MKVSNQETRVGFYTTRIVEALTAEKAEDAAVASIRNDRRLRDSVINETLDPPKIFIEQLVEVAYEIGDPTGAGFTFFDE